MKVNKLMALAIVMGCAACTGGVGGGGGSGEALDYDRCLALLEKGAELQGAPVAALGELLEVGAQECADRGRIRESHYTCGMAANSVQEMYDCKIPTN